MNYACWGQVKLCVILYAAGVPVHRSAPAAPFGFSGKGLSGKRSDFAWWLNFGAPCGSVKQKEHRHVEEEEITRTMLERLDYEGRQDDGQDAVLNLDSVSEKVSQTKANFTL